MTAKVVNFPHQKSAREIERMAVADLERSGISPDDAGAAGMYFAEDASEASPDFKALPALVIPYFDPLTGEQLTFGRGSENKPFVRIRYLQAPVQMKGFKKAKAQRYAQPFKSPVFAYFPIAKAVNWREVLADPESPCIFVEGEKKALAGCIAGLPCIALGGVYNFICDGELLPELAAIDWSGRDVYICYDSDAATNRDVQLAERRLCAELTRRGAVVYFVRLPVSESGDKVGLDDFLIAKGRDALFDLLDAAQPVKPGQALVVEGTDVEIAEAVLRDIEDVYASRVVACEGDFYVYQGSRWRTIPEHEIANAVYAYDRMKCGRKGVIKLSSGRTKSVADIMQNIAAAPDFFADAPTGINCASGFVRFDERGEPWLEPHSRDHSQRHCLSASWRPGDEWRGDGLLGRFLTGCFGEDEDFEDRVRLVAEICGVAALGVATGISEPKAVVAFGQSAANGKSELLEIVSRLLPADAVCSVPPTRFNDACMMVKLVGRKLNTCSELGTAQAIAADVFKSAVTGDQIMGRDLYRPAVFFRPAALHLFATNTLPSFHGGFDRGVQRRLLMLHFNRSIPPGEQVASIGARIAAEEGDSLLAFAVEGAGRVLKAGRFTEPASSKVTLNEWIFGADPVLAWYANRVEYVAGERIPTKTAYADFALWAEETGFRKSYLPASNNFVQRLLAQDGRLSNTRDNQQRYITWLRLRRSGGAARRKDASE